MKIVHDECLNGLLCSYRLDSSKKLNFLSNEVFYFITHYNYHRIAMLNETRTHAVYIIFDQDKEETKIEFKKIDSDDEFSKIILFYCMSMSESYVLFRDEKEKQVFMNKMEQL